MGTFVSGVFQRVLMYTGQLHSKLAHFRANLKICPLSAFHTMLGMFYVSRKLNFTMVKPAAKSFKTICRGDGMLLLGDKRGHPR